MAQYIYTMVKVRKAHGSKVILDDVTLAFLPGAKIGVVGPNGAGKSTVMKIMAGLETISNGEATLAPGASVGMLEQEPELDETKTVLGNVEEGVAETRALLKRFEELSAAMAEPDADFDAVMEEFGRVQDAIEAANAWDLDAQLEMAMDALRLPPGDAPVTNLSGGERRRVALCKLLLSQPDLLLLDEPTNHLDAESVQWLEKHLADYPGAVLAVTHDRYFLDNVAEWILELDRGRAYPYQGNYSTYLETKQKRLASDMRTQVGKRKALERELEWVRQGAKGRQAKGKARLARFQEMSEEAKRDERAADFDEIQIPPGPRLGAQVVKAEKVSKAYGDRLLIDGLSFTIPPGGIVGVIGANGVGKTTLFRMLIGEEQPDNGNLDLGETVRVAYVDQGRTGLDPKKNVWEAVSGGLDHLKIGDREMPSRAWVGGFGFKGPDQQKQVGVLSGGERNRLNLALTLKQGGNLLLLDEPTNDLDVETLRSLEDALEDFPGSAMVISHDRWFLDKLATHMLAFEGDSQVVWFEGNYADYEADKLRRLGPEAARPHPVTYRKLSRG